LQLPIESAGYPGEARSPASEAIERVTKTRLQQKLELGRGKHEPGEEDYRGKRGLPAADAVCRPPACRGALWLAAPSATEEGNSESPISTEKQSGVWMEKLTLGARVEWTGIQ
jgi:hypothetical protein